ncbi:MAG: phosphatidylserine/phosphatidylglycerophosphate/cardiolipin synthase family protein [Pseudobdellovibrionaceae bacterium]
MRQVSGILKKAIKYFCYGFLSLLALFYVASFAILKHAELAAPKIRDFHDAIFAETTKPQKVTLLDDGLASFYARLKMVEDAKKTINIEFFIYNLDGSSRIFSKALLKKAKDGVKIRMLLDFSFPIFQLWPEYAENFRKAGIEIKYYNLPAFFRWVLLQHRSHRKLLSIDGRAAMIGGRNIADEYFEIGEKYNFWDSDFIIEGSLVKTMNKSFDLYWNSAFASRPEKANPKEFKDETEEDKKILAYIMTEGKKKFDASPSAICRDNLYVTDMPGLEEKHRRVYPVIIQEVAKAEKEIWVESPYFVLRDQGIEDLEALEKKKIKLNILTNSLYSTDAFYTVAALHGQLSRLAKIDMTLMNYNGSPRKHLNAPVKVAKRWGLHGKRAIIDRKTLLIGTYNIDPRSANLNSEILYVCRDSKVLAEAALHDLQLHWSESDASIRDGEVFPSSLFVNATLSQKTLFILSWPLAQAFDFLL